MESVTTIQTSYQDLLAEYEQKLTNLPPCGMGLYGRLISAMTIQRDCEKHFYGRVNPDEYLEEFFQKHIQALDVLNGGLEYLEIDKMELNPEEQEEFQAQDALHIFLFNKTWKTLRMGEDDRNPYQPWIDLIRDRLQVNGFTEEYFKGKKTIDVGCGTGRFSLCMAQLGAECYGIDMGEDSLAYATEIAKDLNIRDAHFVKASAYKLDFEDETFDFAVCNGVLHHLDDPVKALEEIYRVLKPGGEFWLYIEGSGGIYHDLWDVLQKSFMPVPIAQTFDALQAMRVPNIHFWMDKFYAKYHFISWEDNVQRLQKIGFKEVKKLRGTRITDLDMGMFADDPYAKVKFGDGNMRMLITK